ncbi:MAG TPA: bifunctional oligoribonuclease/PAP phosphatase NrnA [Thermomicrobiales bacterium]|nr:bifunctional oligoribonuclease/PAP phosphatase NrnA [Thermomicrobiales bacterium]
MTGALWRLDRQAAEDALELLRGASRVVAPTHQNVDADGLSSAIALRLGLAQLGVELVPVVSDGQLPRSLRFLPGIDEVLVYGKDDLPDYDVLCLVDASDKRRLGDFYGDDPERVSGNDVPIVNIDHHVTNDRYGKANIVEPSAAAAAEIVADLLMEWGTELNRDIAQNLLAGIYGDTLGLRTDSTTSRTLRTSADLVDAGGDPSQIVDALFRIKPRSSVCLWEKALRNVQYTGGLIWTELTKETLDRCGADASEAEGMVNFLVGTEGTHAAALLYANDKGWRVSLRSLPSGVDVAELAAEFGGGGHPRAAGVQIEGGEEEKRAFVEVVGRLAQEHA